MNKDEYGEITNGEDTYKTIANKLKNGNSVIIGWTDEEYTHLDILFTRGAYKEMGNELQRGIKNNVLFVSIMSIGAFGFHIDITKKSAGYVSEKLNLKGMPTTEKFAELLNGIIEKILKGDD